MRSTVGIPAVHGGEDVKQRLLRQRHACKSPRPAMPVASGKAVTARRTLSHRDRIAA
jgi:hypothetical protein